ARRPHRDAAPQARRRPVAPALHPHGAWRGLPLRNRRGAALISLRTRLLIALAYVTLLAIVALGVPLAFNLRDRVDSEVRAQARSQADVVAATASDLLDRASRLRLRRLTDTAAESVSGRVLVVDGKGSVLADSAGTSEVGNDYSLRPESAAALHGDVFQ